MSLDSDLKELADAAVADWPEIALSGQFDTAIKDLYLSHLRFPPFWSPEECDEFITSNADMDATRLTTQFDDLIDTVIDRYGRQHGTRPHDEDAAAMIAAERKAAIHELEFYIEALSDELAGMTIQSLGRGAARMTGCSPVIRRPQSRYKQARHRRRRSR
jgi:hypothetical protein